MAGLAAREPAIYLAFDLQFKDWSHTVHAEAFDLVGLDRANWNFGEVFSDILLLFADRGFVTRENLHFTHGKGIVSALGFAFDFLHGVNHKHKACDTDTVSGSC